MKKLAFIFGVVLAMTMSLCLFACNEEPDPEPDPGVDSVEITHHGRTIDATEYRPDTARFPVVIFSHGYNGYKDDFEASAQFLMENGIGSITFTFCGSGPRDKSGFGTTNMTLYTEKEDLLAVIAYAKRQKWFNGKLFLVGGSQGGMVSAMAAEDRAADIAGMALLFPGFSIPDDWNNRVYPVQDYPTPESIPEVIENYWGVDLGRNFVVTLRNLDIYEKMPDFKKPVLLFHGTADTTVPISYSRRAAETYPDAELIEYTGQGHGFTPNVMREVEAKLLNFIDENW